MGRAVMWTTERIEAATRLREKGATWRELAVLMNMGQGTIRYMIDPTFRRNCQDTAHRHLVDQPNRAQAKRRA